MILLLSGESLVSTKQQISGEIESIWVIIAFLLLKSPNPLTFSEVILTFDKVIIENKVIFNYTTGCIVTNIAPNLLKFLSWRVLRKKTVIFTNTHFPKWHKTRTQPKKLALTVGLAPLLRKKTFQTKLHVLGISKTKKLELWRSTIQKNVWKKMVRSGLEMGCYMMT